MRTMRIPVCLAGACALAPILLHPLHAVRTQHVEHSGFADFLKAETENLSLSGLGTVSLAPAIEEIAILDETVVWGVLPHPQGGLIVGTGNGGKVLHVRDDGEVETLFDSEEVLARALEMDAEGRLYVGTSPDGRIYRIESGRNPEIFFDPAETYIWKMRFDAAGNLFVATGQSGKLYRLPAGFAPGDEPELWFESDRAHITQLEFDAQGKLLLAVSPRSVLYRVQGQDAVEVLAQTDAEEISGMVAQPDGTILFSTFLDKPGGDDAKKTPLDLPELMERYRKQAANGNGKDNPFGFVFRRLPEGFIEPVWSAGGSRIFSLFQSTSESSLIVGTEVDGILYKVKDDQIWHRLQRLPSSGQASYIVPVPDSDDLYVLSSNPAGVYRLVTETSQDGLLTSDVVDAGQTARWGRLRPQGLGGESFGGIQWEVRSGPVGEPDQAWSDWQTLDDGLSMSSQFNRFVQYRATFKSPGDALRAVRLYYQVNNAAPVVSGINVVPVGIQLVNVPQNNRPTVNLNQLLSGEELPNNQREQKNQRQVRFLGSEGFLTAGWKADDPNGDSMRYTVMLKSDAEQDWTTLASEIDVPAYSMNTKGMDDGYYVVKVLATDAPSNPSGQARSGYSVSKPFLVDNSPPAISQQPNAQATPAVIFDVQDGFSVVTEATLTINGGEAINLLPSDGLFDSETETFEVEADGWNSGNHSLVLEVVDEAGNRAVHRSLYQKP
ncbi:MAG: hypothetical protein ACFBZ8_11785 [Opitutales bacterium]